jgi:hypothetical protein
MKTRAATLIGGLAVGLAGLAGATPPDEKPNIYWAKSWESAKAEAMARNVPIFVTFHKDQ